jgi:hypothetical protein
MALVLGKLRRIAAAASLIAQFSNADSGKASNSWAGYQIDEFVTPRHKSANLTDPA